MLGDEPMASDLERMLPAGELKGRRVQIRRITSIGGLGDAQILFIGAGRCEYPQAPPGAARRPSHPGRDPPARRPARRQYDQLHFLLTDRHVRFEISLSAARRAGLNISADLLSVATHSEGGPTGLEVPCDTSPPLFDPSVACSSRLAAP